MMKKTAIALIVAAVAAAPAMAEVKLSGDVTLVLDSYNEDRNSFGGAIDSTDGTDYSQFQMGDDGSELQVDATHDMGNGNEAFAGIELETDPSGSTVTTDNVYVGMRGGFGEIKLGEVGNAYNVAAEKAWDDFNIASAASNKTGSTGIRYTTPAFSGWKGSISTSLPQDNEDQHFGVGVEGSVGNLGLALGALTTSTATGRNFGGGNLTTTTGAAFTDETAVALGASYKLSSVDLAADMEFVSDAQKIDFAASTNFSGYKVFGKVQSVTVTDNDAQSLLGYEVGASRDIGGGFSAGLSYKAWTAPDNDALNDLNRTRITVSKSF